MVRTPRGISALRLLVESLRAFGGELAEYPFWLSIPNSSQLDLSGLEELNIHPFWIPIPDKISHYLFVEKVYACAWAEEHASAQVRSLVWIDPACLIIQPPVLFQLTHETQVAVRPVHIQNVGLTTNEPLDDYWKYIYRTVGINDITTSIRSFVDQRELRSYFNTHAFSVNPAKGLLQRWEHYFSQLVTDKSFQQTTCQDELHQVFLHQAVFSVILASTLTATELRFLPHQYNYPYNLQVKIPSDFRAVYMNDLVSLVYEERGLNPISVQDIQIEEPLRSWLLANTK